MIRVRYAEASGSSDSQAPSRLLVSNSTDSTYGGSPSKALRRHFSDAGEIIPLLPPLLYMVACLSYFLTEKPGMPFGTYLSRRAAENSIDAKEVA